MSNSTYNTELHTSFMPRTSYNESSFLILAKRTSQTVTEFITESRNTRHLINIILDRKSVV